MKEFSKKKTGLRRRINTVKDRGFAFSQAKGNDHLVTDDLSKNVKQRALQKNLYAS